jgi:glycosyltransferase involved in cell wall biosynthesis
VAVYGVLIPAYEADKTVACVVTRCLAASGVSGVIVVDDGSHDNTFVRAERAGAICLRHEVNQGKGAALCTGFSEASQRGWDAAITIDADGQHDPAAIPSFLEEHARAGPGIVVGTRKREAGMPFQRRLSNRLSSAVVSRLAGVHVADSQSGYRLIAREVWESVPISASRYDMESELLVRAARRGFIISSVPIPTVYGNETSHFHPFRDTARMMRVFWRLFLERP